MTDFPTPRKTLAEFFLGRRRSSAGQAERSSRSIDQESRSETDSRFIRDTPAFKERYRRWQNMLWRRHRAENPRPPMPEPTPAERRERMLRLMEDARLIRLDGNGQEDEKDDESDYTNEFDRPTSEWTILVPLNLPDHLEFSNWADPDDPTPQQEDAKRQQSERKRDEA